MKMYSIFCVETAHLHVAGNDLYCKISLNGDNIGMCVSEGRNKIILFGAGDEGIKALNHLQDGEIAYFTDNDKNKWGRDIQGIQVISPEEAVKKELPIYITPGSPYRQMIMKQLEQMTGLPYKTIQWYIAEKKISSDKRIQGLKDRFLGQRCFIIGTGPSLRIEDLELLKEHNEVTFASNRIFKMFDKTSWKPDLYCVSDFKLLKHYFDVICDLDIQYQFVVNINVSGYRNEVEAERLLAPNRYIFNILKYYEEYDGQEMPGFSEDASRYVVDGGITVTYSMLQWAYYLGFSEVYLLGVDFDYSDATGSDSGKKDHCIENYVDANEEVNTPKLEESLKAYIRAKDFGEKHGFCIYNATRGGKLEVFERKKFEELFTI